MVLSTVGSFISTIIKRLAKAWSFSMYFRYSMRVVAPITLGNRRKKKEEDRKGKKERERKHEDGEMKRKKGERKRDEEIRKKGILSLLFRHFLLHSFSLTRCMLEGLSLCQLPRV